MSDDGQYEYAVRVCIPPVTVEGLPFPKDYSYILGNWNDDKSYTELWVKRLKTDPIGGHQYKVVRRIKAGPEEDVE